MANNIIVVHYARIMRVDVKILCIIVVMLLSADMAAQSHNLPEPQMDSKQMVPPPPGLPIDFGISALIAAGLGLGIHHLRNRK
ncbi:hypothetical protein LB467_15780 [Salegentibacter sp. JZCK2]|uniref:PID-CTERM protein-sorting domain-containing protein n=1 Tax=Salegentibacter tibetensis TaxID=2873600 RepID=UPI001CCE9F10|nr:hypothetical protein [Salegentibacter tibetensis]MBZ9731154.1 hypothetical protein [Salegentibacter tibetensis]